MGKLLILAWGVYPSTGGSTIILNNISEGFSKDGLVLVGQKPPTEPEVSWESKSDIKLYYLDPFYFNFRKRQKLTKWLKWGSNMKQLKQIIKTEKVTRILSIFPDEYYCHLGYSAAKELGLPFDIWFHNSYIENRTGILKKIASKLQPLFFRADRVFVMSDGLNKEMSKRYPYVKFTTLVHGFKFDNNSAPLNLSSEKITFLYSGSLNASCEDASVRLLSVLMRHPNYEIHIFSGNPKAFERHNIAGKNVFFHKFLPLDEFVASLAKYDFMLLPHGFTGLRSDFEYKTIFPTRTIPLLFSNRPIIAHSPKGSFLSDFIDQQQCALLIESKDEQEIDQAITALINDRSLQANYIKNAKRSAELFKLKNVVDIITEPMTKSL